MAVSAPLGVNPLTLRCDSGCGSVRIYRVEPMGRIPSVFNFCPVCGGHASAVQDHEADQYEAWAHDLDTDPLIVKTAFEAWDYHTHPSFMDFIREILAEAS